MTHARSAARRPGFTLLEVLLSAVIGILLLGGVYTVFEMTLKRTDSGRTAVDKGGIARAIVNRMSADLTVGIGPLQPKSGGGVTQDSNINSGTSATTGTAATGTATTTTGTTGGTTGSATGTTGATTGATTGTDSTDTSADTATTTDQSLAADVPFQGGVFGTDKQLTLYVSRVPKDLLDASSAEQTLLGGDPKPDLRRVTYYLSATGGLCRQEQFLVTADGVRNSTDPDHGRETQDLIAEEVTDVTFEYFDGSTWTNTWAGDDDAGDGKTVKGPPRAVRMTLAMLDADGATKTIVHVFPIRAAVGQYTPPPPADDTTTDPAATGGSE